MHPIREWILHQLFLEIKNYIIFFLKSKKNPLSEFLKAEK